MVKILSVRLNDDNTASIQLSYDNGDFLMATVNADKFAELITANVASITEDYSAKIGPQAEECSYDESMDGDHQSALASCGWGTDEDYGYFGGDE